jgi:hypothetical protein
VKLLTTFVKSFTGRHVQQQGLLLSEQSNAGAQLLLSQSLAGNWDLTLMHMYSSLVGSRKGCLLSSMHSSRESPLLGGK